MGFSNRNRGVAIVVVYSFREHVYICSHFLYCAAIHDVPLQTPTQPVCSVQCVDEFLKAPPSPDEQVLKTKSATHAHLIISPVNQRQKHFQSSIIFICTCQIKPTIPHTGRPTQSKAPPPPPSPPPPSPQCSSSPPPQPPHTAS